MEKTSLKITVAGIRGKIGESLLPGVALDFAEIFGTYVNGKTVVLATETRLSTAVIKAAVISGLLATGCKIIDIGVVSTPTTQFMVKHLKAEGGIMISASHNPIMWNGLKFISPVGIFLDEDQMGQMFKKYYDLQEKKKMSATNEELALSGIVAYMPVEKLGSLEYFSEANVLHIERILKFIEVEAITKAGLKVVVDCCNGAGAVLNPILFNKLGIEVILINDKPDGRFSREPEPLPENIVELGKAVLKYKADIGFAQDPDADRLAIVNEKGQPIGEDYTLVLAMKYILSKHPSPAGKVVATNLSTTRAFDDVANAYKAKIIHTKIGEVNVSKALLNNDSIVGGEGNGGVIAPQIGLGRDSFAGMCFILEYLAKSQKTISQLVSEVPAYKVVKKKKELNSVEEVASMLGKVRTYYKGEEMDETDGVKVIFKDSWLHVRASNTEPIVRYFAEAKDLETAEKLIAAVF